jgi:hypothetical protein
MRFNKLYTLSVDESARLAAYWQGRGLNVEQDGDALEVREPCECCGLFPCACFGGV